MALKQRNGMMLAVILLFKVGISSSLFSRASASENQRCITAISSVRSEMATKYAVKTVRDTTSPISKNDFASPFQDGHRQLLIDMRAPRINIATGQDPGYQKLIARFSAFLASRGIQERLASTIMAACDDIDIVTFFVHGSGENRGIFRMPNGRVKAGEALDCGPGLPRVLRWGTFPSC